MANQTWPVQTQWIVSSSSQGVSAADRASLCPFCAMVPSDVHKMLLEEGVIADPFVGYNVEAVQWIGQQVWTWETTVERPALDGLKTDFVDILRLDGLDTYATVSG